MAGTDVKISDLGEASVLLDTDILLEVTEVNNQLVTIGVPASEIKEYAIGDTSISGIGDGTPTGAISALNVSKAAKADIAPQEATTASKTYNPGDEFYLSGVLYRAKTTISSGTAWASLTLDTDYEVAPDMTSQIQTLANSLSTETTNRQNADSAIWDNVNNNGSVNIAGPTELTTQRISGVTFTVNPNGTITASNEQAESGITLTISDYVHLTPGTYKLVGGKDANNFLFLGYTDGGGWQALSQTTSQDAVTFTVTSERSDFRLGIYVSADETPNFEFRPMITRSDYPYCDYAHYVPYAKTNRELTDDLGVKFYELSSYKGSNVTTLECTAIKFNECVFITGYWEGNNKSNEPILTIPSKLRPLRNTKIKINAGTVKYNNALYSSAYVVTNAGGIYQNLTANAASGGSFTAIYSISKSLY